MDGRGEPRHQPIGMLPTIARLIDEGLTDTQEQYATLLASRPKPWVLDNTIDRQLAKSDTQLGLEYLLGFGPPLPARHPPS